jgi:spermidine synthase
VRGIFTKASFSKKETNTLKTNAEMLVHTALCTHPEVEKILIINEDDYIKTELDKHEFGEKVSIQGGDDIVNAISNFADAEFDAVIVNAKLTADDELFMARLSKILKTRGLAVFASDTFYSDALKATLQTLPKEFNIAMPQYAVSEDGVHGFVFCSKKYHPTADIILQKSDLLDGNDYYNSEIQLNSFILPNEYHKSLTGYARR